MGILFVAANLHTVRGVRGLSRVNTHTTPIINGRTILEEGEDYHEFHRWARNNGFEAKELIDLHGMPGLRHITLGIWYKAREKVFLYAEIAQKKGIHDRSIHWVSFVTDLDRDGQLKSSDNRDSQNVPMGPETLHQSFHGMALTPLYEAHRAALNHVVHHLGRLPVERLEPYYEAENQDTLRQVAYIRSLPFWWLRGFYWQFVSRYVRNNVSVARQYPPP